MIRLLSSTVAALLALVSGTASAKDKYVYGPAPEWSRYKELAEPAVRAKLPAGGRWSIAWPNGYMQGGWRHKGRFPGYLTCGVLQAETPVDGRYPRINFVAVIDYDLVQTVDISSRESNSLVNIMCQTLVSQGQLPPAHLMTAARESIPENIPVTSLGLQIRAMAEGAYIVAVAPGSMAQRAGLAPGTVVVRANGIALSGLGAAMAAVLGSDVPVLALDTAAGTRVELQRAP